MYWGNDLEFLFNQIENGLINTKDVIFLQGYSGWNLNQLDNEIENNSWIVLDNQPNMVFKLSKKNSWNKIIKSLGDKYKIWSNSPDDITQN